MAARNSDSMTLPPQPVAHLIIGRRAEPYLEASLHSAAAACGHLVVNDNSPAGRSPHADALGASDFGRDGRMTLLRTSFVDFASARNACIDGTPPQFREGWALFFDADEVHGPELPAMSGLLRDLPADVAAVDGYSRHFVGSFRWYSSVARRLCFFRLSTARRWHGPVHEQLAPVARRIALPAVWSHYGHVVTPRMEAEKGRLYSSLGQAGSVVTEHELDALDAQVWRAMLKTALPFSGRHEPAVLETVRTLTGAWAGTFAQVDALARTRSGADWALAALKGANIARLITLRRVEARLRFGWPDRYHAALLNSSAVR
ncbi:MAG: hypothetical protein GIW99_08235 [Candidatus Eremiobacteraeota bacterium]|nr:hypothetical protein [Candidatus Eremiobacteraeota bacterium]MBC5827651.1 hypothetical protein [Candidatus Eremiobacteraeota bacterium]